MVVPDLAGATLNGVSPTTISYTIGGLKPDADFNLFVWNLTAKANSPSTERSALIVTEWRQSRRPCTPSSHSRRRR